MIDPFEPLALFRREGFIMFHCSESWNDAIPTRQQCQRLLCQQPDLKEGLVTYLGLPDGPGFRYA